MSKSDPSQLAIAFTENLSGVLRPQAPDVHPHQMPDLTTAFSQSSGIVRNGSTPVSEMGASMQQTLSPVMSASNSIDLRHVDLHRQGLQEISGAKIDPKGASALSEGAGYAADIGGEAISAIGNVLGLSPKPMNPAPTMQPSNRLIMGL